MVIRLGRLLAICLIALAAATIYALAPYVDLARHCSPLTLLPAFRAVYTGTSPSLQPFPDNKETENHIPPTFSPSFPSLRLLALRRLLTLLLSHGLPPHTPTLPPSETHLCYPEVEAGRVDGIFGAGGGTTPNWLVIEGRAEWTSNW